MNKKLTNIILIVLIAITIGCKTPLKDTVKIGGKVWMVKNLDVSTFRNGDPIPQVITEEEWFKANMEGTPAWCYYDNDSSNNNKFGKLYNFYVIKDPRGIAPDGWHIATIEEWNELYNSLGDNAAQKLKSKTVWSDNRSDNPCKGTNESGFNAMPGGRRYIGGLFEWGNERGYWWSSTIDENGAYDVWLSCNNELGHHLGGSRDNVATLHLGIGEYIRCVKN